MKNSLLSRLYKVFLVLLIAITVTISVFYGYLPKTYDYAVGSVSSEDIYAPRNFVDNYETKYKAVLAKNSVSAIFVRSDSISESNIDNVTSFYSIIAEYRSQLLDDYGMPLEDVTPLVTGLIDDESSSLGVTLSNQDAVSFLSMSSSLFSFIQDKAIAMTEMIMIDSVDSDALQPAIDDEISSFNEMNSSYSSYSNLISKYLSAIIIPNSVFDSEATDEAAENAYVNAMNEPVEVEKGTKIVSEGDVITEHTFQNLSDLDLLTVNTFDYLLLARIGIYIVLILCIFIIYLNKRQDRLVNDIRMLFALAITFCIPVYISVYASNLSSLAVFVLFYTTIAATYLGISGGIITSIFCFLLIWPVYNFDVEACFITLVGILVCATISGKQTSKHNSASIIIFSVMSVIAASFCINFINSATHSEYINSIVWSGISAVGSVVFAIGLMPIFELLSNAVSPIRLIELSQPGHPLMKRLFVEAPGTSQHSMMVSNLSDSAADAINADALLCKVASYYHDIGKLENPEYFTENQKDGINPHDKLTPEESVEIITAHTVNGVKLARKYKLPDSIIDIIFEHHGTTYPKYFYYKAKEIALKAGKEEPDFTKYCYKGRVPQTRESAIIMLADTCEAAVKSSKSSSLSDAEALMRKLIKEKIDKDQLVSSGLSFDDIEKIIEAFVHVYAGFFHERIKYPE